MARFILVVRRMGDTKSPDEYAHGCHEFECFFFPCGALEVKKIKFKFMTQFWNVPNNYIYYIY